MYVHCGHSDVYPCSLRSDWFRRNSFGALGFATSTGTPVLAAGFSKWTLTSDLSRNDHGVAWIAASFSADHRFCSGLRVMDRASVLPSSPMTVKVLDPRLYPTKMPAACLAPMLPSG